MHIDVVPLPNARGKYVLQEITTLDTFIRTRTGAPLQKTRKRVWPPTKLENGRGTQFDTRREAMEFFRDNRGTLVKVGPRTLSLLERL